MTKTKTRKLTVYVLLIALPDKPRDLWVTQAVFRNRDKARKYALSLNRSFEIFPYVVQ